MYDMSRYYMQQEDRDERSANATYIRSLFARNAFMNNPKNIDTLAASVTAQLSPSTKAAKKSDFNLQVDAVDSVIPDDHPLKGFSHKLSDVIARSLMDERTLGYSPLEIAQTAATQMLSLPGRSGKTDIATEMYEHKREADAAWFGIGGDDEDVRKPAIPGYKGYDQWLAERKKAELEAYKEDPLWKPEGSTAAMIGASALVGGYLGGPPGMVLGAAGGLLTDIVGSPFAHAIRHSEWYKSKRNRADVSNWDIAKTMAAEVSPYMLIGGKIDKSLFAALRTPKAVGAHMKMNLAKPATVTQSVIDSGEMIKVSKQVMKDKGVVRRFVDKFFDDRGMQLGFNQEYIDGWKNAFSKADKTAVNELAKAAGKVALSKEDIIAKYQDQLPDYDPIKGMPPEKALANATLKLDAHAIEMAAKHPDGTVAGIMDAYRLKIWRDLGSIEKWNQTDELIGLASREAQKAADKGQEVIGKVLSKTDYGKGGEFIKFDQATSKPIYSGVEGAPVQVAEETITRTPAEARAAKRAKHAKKVASTPTVEKIAKSLGDEGNKFKDDIAARSADIEADPLAKAILEKTTEITESEVRTGSKTPSTAEAVVEAKSIVGPRARKKAVAALKEKKASEEVVSEAVKQGKSAKFKNVREAADEAALKEREIREQFSDINPHEALETLSEYDRMLKAGEITYDEALELGLRVQDGLAASDNITPSGFEFFADQTEEWFNQLRRIVGNKTFMVMMGAGASIYGIFGPDTSEASVMSSIAKGLKGTDAAKTYGALIKSAKAARLTGIEVTDKTMVVEAKKFQQGLKGTADTGPVAFIRELPNLMRTIKSDFIGRRLMGPYQQMNAVLPGKLNLAINPAVYRASYSAAEYSNTSAMKEVIDNWVRNYPMIKSERHAIAKMFDPLIEPMKNQVSFEFALDRVKVLKTEIDRLMKDKKLPVESKEAQIDIATAELEGYEKMVKDLAGSVEKFHGAYQSVAEQAAKKFTQARIYYALDDTAEFNKYPFMKKYPLTAEEKEIVGIMREQMLHYKARIDELKVPTISGPYVAHILHPKFKIKEALNQFGGESARAAYMQFYRRSKNSRPLLPDIEDTMRRYVSDTERRIQQQQFAKEWEPVKKRVHGMPVLQEAFEELERGVNPVADTFWNRTANFYSSFEVFKRLFLNPSAGLKHLIKAAGDVSTAGFKSATISTPTALDMTLKRIVFANPAIRKKLTEAGITLSEQDKLLNGFFNSIVPAKRLRERVIDWGLDSTDEHFHGIKAVWQNIQNVGSAWINLAELFDRGLSIATGLNLATKKGMTIEQSMYGIYDMILKNNFLGREFNPRWLKNPKIKAAMLFQGTPYKIFERRVVNAYRSGKVIKDLGKNVWEATKTDEGRRMLLKDLRDMRTYIKGGEHELKANLIIDTIRQDTDFYGTPIINQFMKDMLITAAATYGGASVGMNLKHHFFHLPFLSTQTQSPTLAISPGLQAINKGYFAWKEREEGDDEFLFTKIMQKWLGTGWYAALPDTVKKVSRLSQNDIPKIYQDSKFRYLFAIPGAH